MKNLQKILLIVLSFFAFTACNDDDSDKAAPQGTSRVRVNMTDAPGDFDAVFVEVVDVKIKASADAGEDGWVSVGNIEPRIYNLLDLTGGVTVLLADNVVPSGYLGQIRLILGDENTVVIDGETHPLNTPSAQQSGLKLQVNQTLLPDVTYDFLIDFDVAQSVVVAGNSGNINLHPVLHLSTQAASGSITGIALVPGFQTMVSVDVNGTPVSAYANAEGVFYLHGIPSGTYAVTITPDPLSGLGISIVQNVTVVNGQVTNMGTITID